MRVGEGGGGDERAGAVEVPCGRDVVTGFIPEVGESQEGEVRDVKGDEEDGEDHPEGERSVKPRLQRTQIRELSPLHAGLSSGVN